MPKWSSSGVYHGQPIGGFRIDAAGPTTVSVSIFCDRRVLRCSVPQCRAERLDAHLRTVFEKAAQAMTIPDLGALFWLMADHDVS